MMTIKERPVLFGAPMVRAMLESRKSVTRRVVKVQPFDLSWSRRDHRFEYLSGRAENGDEIDGFYVYTTRSGGEWSAKCPYGQRGDRLWVRETFYAFGRWETRFSQRKGRDKWHFVDLTLEHFKAYQFETPQTYCLGLRGDTAPAWWKRPSIFMPRIASRILLEITGVRVERLQDISEEQAKAEGLLFEDGQWSGAPGLPSFGIPVPAFAHLWISINGVEGWNANPWVWVVEFRRVTP